MKEDLPGYLHWLPLDHEEYVDVHLAICCSLRTVLFLLVARIFWLSHRLVEFKFTDYIAIPRDSLVAYS